GLDRLEQEHEATQRWEHDKMRSMTGETHHGWTGGQQSVAGSGDQSSQCIEQTPRQKKNQECGRGVDQEQTEMNSSRRLPEDCEDQGVCRESAGQLHAVGKLVRRYTLQHQLPGVGVFPFVPFQGALPYVETNEGEEQNYQQQQSV